MKGEEEEEELQFQVIVLLMRPINVGKFLAQILRLRPHDATIVQ